MSDRDTDADPEKDSDDPFAELGRKSHTADASEEPVNEPSSDEADDPFEEVAPDGQIRDVWETLDGGESPLEDIEKRDKSDEEVIDKRSFCQRCRYLSDPPIVECTIEGSEIVEVVDIDRFRVRGCPMVERGGPESDTR